VSACFWNKYLFFILVGGILKIAFSMTSFSYIGILVFTMYIVLAVLVVWLFVVLPVSFVKGYKLKKQNLKKRKHKVSKSSKL